jgi:hypothetical protein
LASVYIQYLGATAYIATEEFDKCIDDCDKALELNDKFVKVICSYIILSQKILKNTINRDTSERLKL